MPETPLIIQIQRECLDKEISVSDILRKAKVAAVKLELVDFQEWINNELNGYTKSAEELPPYRQLHGELKVFNPYRGWQPVFFEDPSSDKRYSSAPLGQAIGPLEAGLRETKPKSFHAFSLSPERKNHIINMLEVDMDIALFLNKTMLDNIVELVRNILLDWTLEMEKSGIIGDGMSFKKEEKSQATQITQYFSAHNIGFAGNAQDRSEVTTIQNIHSNELNLSAVYNIIQQAEQEIHRLPKEMQVEVGKSLSEINVEIKKEHPNHSKVRILLSSLKNICEGTVGNLAAQGIAGINRAGNRIAVPDAL